MNLGDGQQSGLWLKDELEPGETIHYYYTAMSMAVNEGACILQRGKIRLVLRLPFWPLIF